MCTDYDWPGARVDYQEISSQYLVLGIEVFTMGAYANVNLSDAKLCLLIYKNIFAAAKDLCPVHYRALFISSLNGAPRSLSKDEWTLGVDIQCGHYHYSALLHSPCSSACKHGAIMKGGFCGLSMRCPNNNNDDPRGSPLAATMNLMLGSAAPRLMSRASHSDVRLCACPEISSIVEGAKDCSLMAEAGSFYRDRRQDIAMEMEGN